MPVISNFERKILDLIRGSRYDWFTTGVNLGGVPGVSGGSGGPPGGFTGQLIQSRVTYDTSEESSLDVPPSGQSLVHNLNRIRYWLDEKSDALVVLDEGGQVASGISVLDFVGAPVEVTEAAGIVTITVSGTGGNGGGETVKVSSDDTVANYLENKLADGTKITTSTLNPGGNEQVEIAFDGLNLGEVGDVTISSVGNDEVLGYSGGWINRTLAEAAIAPSVHTHVEANITDLEHDAIKLQGETISASSPSQGEALIYTGSEYIPSGVGAASDTKEVKVSSNDTTPAFLEDKLQAGTNITLNILNEGANEKIEIVASGGGSALEIKDEGTQVTAAASSVDFVGSYIEATSDDGNVTVTVSGVMAEVPDFKGCRTYLTSDVQISTDNGWQTVDYDAENYDTDSFWSTGGTHIMPEDGYYNIVGQVTFSGAVPTAERLEVSLFDGSTPIAHMYGGYYASSPGMFTYNMGVDWYFSASDDVNMRILCGDATQPYILSEQDKTFMCTHKIEGAYLAEFVGCYVRVTGYDNDPADNTPTAVHFDASNYEIGGDWWTSGDDTKITFPEDGYYSIKSHLLWQAMDETPFEIYHAIRLNGTTYLSTAYDITIDNDGDRTEGNTTLCALDYNFSTNDYIEVIIWHDRGSTYNDAIRPGDGYSYIAVHKIGGS